MLQGGEFDWGEWFATTHLSSIVRAGVILVVGLPLLRWVARLSARLLGKRLSPQTLMVARKALLYVGTFVVVVMAMRELGFKLTTLLGAAGIAGIALGFASQTSLSNLISGLFLIWEKPFEVGDVLDVGDTRGEVHSVDLLSLKIRTYDNKLVRIPNENLLKTEFTNITRFPIRRFDVPIGVAYKEDVGRAMEILREVADGNPYCLDEPAPVVIFRGFGESALELLLGVWFAKEDFLSLRNSIIREVKERFDAEGIEIPFPHRTLFAGTAGEPFPVRVVEASAPRGPGREARHDGGAGLAGRPARGPESAGDRRTSGDPGDD